MLTWLVATFSFFYSVIGHGSEVLDADVTHADGRYSVRFDVRLAAPLPKLKHHIWDYENYPKHFKTVEHVEVLGRTADGALRVRMRLSSCVWFFCRTVRTLKDIREQADGTILARIDPTQSDFREATERWVLRADGDATRLQYSAELEPTFYVPPLIGPWLLKRKIRQLLETSAEKFEELAHD